MMTKPDMLPAKPVRKSQSVSIPGLLIAGGLAGALAYGAAQLSKPSVNRDLFKEESEIEVPADVSVRYDASVKYVDASKGAVKQSLDAAVKYLDVSAKDSGVSSVDASRDAGVRDAAGLELKVSAPSVSGDVSKVFESAKNRGLVMEAVGFYDSVPSVLGVYVEVKNGRVKKAKVTSKANADLKESVTVDALMNMSGLPDGVYEHSYTIKKR